MKKSWLHRVQTSGGVWWGTQNKVKIEPKHHMGTQLTLSGLVRIDQTQEFQAQKNVWYMAEQVAAVAPTKCSIGPIPFKDDNLQHP